MKRRIMCVFLSAALLCSCAGCIAVPLVAIGAIGGYAVSKDTIQGDSDKQYDSLWSSALSVSKAHGAIKVENAEQGSIEFISGKSRVWVRLSKLTRSTTRVRVSSRKYHMPHLDLAQTVFTKIIDQAE